MNTRLERSLRAPAGRSSPRPPQRSGRRLRRLAGGLLVALGLGGGGLGYTAWTPPPVDLSMTGQRVIGNPSPAAIKVRVTDSGDTVRGVYTPSQAAGISDARPLVIAQTIADDDFAPGHHPAERPARAAARSAAPVQPVTDPTIDLLTAQAVAAQGLSPAAATAAAHAQAVAEGREWYVRLTVDEPATGYHDHNSVLGQLLTAADGYDPRDLVELPPFGRPSLTLVFPRPTWGAHAGDYSCDFRAAQRRGAGGRPLPGVPAGDWPFAIRSDRPGTQVVLRWSGDLAILQRTQLIDQATGQAIKPTAKAYANGYPVTLTTGTRAFIWRYQGQPGPLR